jgi:transcriptional regulator with XRE-family HTH domain
VSWQKSDEALRWQRQFGRRLRALRNASGLSQMDLAHRADLHPTYVSSVERGQRNISLVNIHVLARALKIRPERFFTDQ